MNKIEIFLRRRIQHYNAKKYWKLRARVMGKNKYPKWLKYFWLMYIKKCDAFNGASLGTYLGHGAVFETPPSLPHGLYGIIVSQNARIGKNARIMHQVTIGEDEEGAPTIGDNVFIGAGAKITGKIRIGNNVKIGTNCVVFQDIPDNATVVMQKPRIIVREEPPQGEE